MERFVLELDPPEEAMRRWPHVVVVGGGFAGLRICHGLAGQPVRVTLFRASRSGLAERPGHLFPERTGSPSPT